MILIDIAAFYEDGDGCDDWSCSANEEAHIIDRMILVDIAAFYNIYVWPTQ